MVFLYRLSFFIVAMAALGQTLAQPMDYLRMKGCRYAMNAVAQPQLTDEERLLVCGSNARSDSIDILNYDVTLDLTNFAGQTLRASCELTLTPKQASIAALPLDLLALEIDSVVMGGDTLSYDYDDLLLNVHFPTPLPQGDTAQVTVYYHGHPTVDPSGFGGFVFDQNIGYNLGIGLASNPYNFGRSWHPCFDNFVERATYDITLISNGGRKGYATGELVDSQNLGGDTLMRRYRMSLPLPTYLVGSATSNYIEHHDTHSGAYGDYPVLLVGKPADSLDMVEAFSYLDDAVDVLEAWYGPYIWGQVGYVMTTRGAMEHASLIAFPVFSIASGPEMPMNRLMSHELAHHWWGNITTLSCPDNMWIKEGNAEYGAHLFTEFAFGKEEFIKQVKNNHYNVLQNAHKDDGGNFLPLSGIPYEYTYGTHTYNKGASVMHNLRGYLGDSLFQQGMRSILDTYGLEAVDAEQFRDQLTANTGVDMTSFFDDWIYAPGFAAYELDSVIVEPADIPEEFEATLYVQQKLRAAPHFHTNVPLEVTFYDEDWNAWHSTIMVSGEFSSATVNVPFNPVWTVLNDRNQLNLASTQNKTTVYEEGDINLQFSELVTFDAITVPDSALINIIHYWVGADPIEPNPTGAQISNTHYWRFDGIIPAGFKAKATMQYKGANPLDFDYELTNGNEDSLILVWRPRPGIAWKEYPWYKKLTLGGNTDGNGFIRIDSMIPGDYAFANGHLEVATSTLESTQYDDVLVYPNPNNGTFNIEARLPKETKKVTATLYSLTGAPMWEDEYWVSGGQLSRLVSVPQLAPGLYFLKIGNARGKMLYAGKVLLRQR